MKSCEIVCYMLVLWWSRWIPVYSCIRLWCLWHTFIIVSFGHVHDLIWISNTQSYSQYLSSWVLTSRNWMMVYFSFIKLYLFAKSWKPQGWIIVMGCQHPLMFRYLLVQIIIFLRIKILAQLIFICNRYDFISNINHKTQYLLCCSSVCMFYP